MIRPGVSLLGSLRQASFQLNHQSFFSTSALRRTMTSAQPILLCGRSEAIASVVIEALKPEYNVIHLILTPDAGCAQIPLLLRGKQAPSDSTLGSKDYSTTPIAVLTGAGYNESDVERMMKACEGEGEGEGEGDVKKVPWLRPDPTKASSMPPPGPEYGKAIVARAKERLAALQAGSEMDGMRVVWF